MNIIMPIMSLDDNYFILISILVGITQIIDGVLLYKSDGEAETISTYLSFFELVWAVNCIIQVYGDLSQYYYSPTIFTAYYVFHFTYGFLFMKKEIMESEKAIKIPKWSIYLGLGFGIFYTIYNILILAKVFPFAGGQ